MKIILEVTLIITLFTASTISMADSYIKCNYGGATQGTEAVDMTDTFRLGRSGDITYFPSGYPLKVVHRGSEGLSAISVTDSGGVLLWTFDHNFTGAVVSMSTFHHEKVFAGTQWYAKCSRYYPS